jgi:CheY-like chemotaxis protein
MTMPIHTPTVLVVDDDPEELASTCKALGSRYPVLAATSGEDALRVARSARPSVIVLDVMMAGGKDGFTTFHELQGDPATRDIPVIFLTNVGKATGLPFGSAELGKYLGWTPAAFLEKPVSTDKLLRAVAKSLDERKDGPAEGGAVCKQS